MAHRYIGLLDDIVPCSLQMINDKSSYAVVPRELPRLNPQADPQPKLQMLLGSLPLADLAGIMMRPRWILIAWKYNALLSSLLPWSTCLEETLVKWASFRTT